MSDYRWPGGKRLALSIVVNVEEGSEQSLRDGDKGPEPVDELGVSVKLPIRNYGNESNYRYGIVEGFPRIARLLDEYGVTATFTAAALALERAPDIADYIRARGHEPCCHGWRWVHQFKMDESAEREFIRKGVDSIRASCGVRPLGWLSRYLHTDNTRRLLAEEGFLYHMDDYSADAPFWDIVAGRPMVIVPYALDSNDMKFWTSPSLTPDAWLQYAIDTFDVLYAEGAEQPRMMSLGLHLRIIGRPGRIHALEQFLQYATSKSDVWVTSRQKIAEHFVANVPLPVPA
jgi:peptidoglycan/xylan/chitin deacetylase (PgdA/CDA1 family)